MLGGLCKHFTETACYFCYIRWIVVDLFGSRLYTSRVEFACAQGLESFCCITPCTPIVEQWLFSIYLMKPYLRHGFLLEETLISLGNPSLHRLAKNSSYFSDVLCMYLRGCARVWEIFTSEHRQDNARRIFPSSRRIKIQCCPLIPATA